VDDAECVSRADTSRHLYSDVETFAQAHAGRHETPPERRALDVFQRDEPAAIPRVAKRVDDADVGMVQCRGRARFLLESPELLLVGEDVGTQDFDGNLASEAKNRLLESGAQRERRWRIAAGGGERFVFVS
jgi:hypothetical protein